jgi:hypothetical protein
MVPTVAFTSFIRASIPRFLLQEEQKPRNDADPVAHGQAHSVISRSFFERAYWLTPFTMDAQARVRGKCPLELTGYDVEKLPLVRLCGGGMWACH